MQFGWGACHDTISCIVAGDGLNGWWIVSRYTMLHRDRDEGLAVGGCVTIQSLYHDKRAVWLRVCHDTIDCIVTRG